MKVINCTRSSLLIKLAGPFLQLDIDLVVLRFDFEHYHLRDNEDIPTEASTDVF